MKAIISVLIMCSCESNASVTPPIQPAVAPTTAGEQLSTTGSLPDVATVATGDAIAIWREVPARDEHRLLARRRHAGSWSPEQTVVALTSGEVFWPRVAMAPDGRAIAVWQQLDLGKDREPTDHGVWTAHFDPLSGWTHAMRIGEHSDNSVISGSSVRLAIGADGSACAVWPLKRSGRKVLLASTYRNGNWIAPVAIASNASEDARSPQVAIDRSGNAMVVWEQSSRIWSARFVSDRWLAAAPVERHDGGESLTPQLEIADDGSATAIWERRYGRSTIESAAFHAERGWSQPEAIQTDGADGTTPRLAGGIAIWVSRTTSGDELWSRPHMSAGWGTAHHIASTWAYELLVAKAASHLVVVQRDRDGCASSIDVAPDGTWGRPIPFASCSPAYSDAVAAFGDGLVAWSHGTGVRVFAPPIPAVAPVRIPVVAPKPDDGRVFSIVRVTQRFDECSGAGGEHYVLTLDDGTRRLAHAGGHAVDLDLIPKYSALKDPQAPGRYMVAELILYPPRDPDADRNPDSSSRGWCLDRLPRFDASATRLLPATDAADARRLLDQVERLGMPPSAEGLAPASSRDELAIARVIDVAPDAASVELESIEGWVPRRLAVRPGTALTRGDAVVVATSASIPTRVLFPDDLASARRWAAEIRADRWPTDPIVIPYAITAARWTTVATVIPGRKGCGPTIRAPHGIGSSLMLPLDAPAPAEAKLGDRLIAVVFARATPDRCGHTARVVRAYPAPAGLTLDTFRGIVPRGLTPLVE